MSRQGSLGIDAAICGNFVSDKDGLKNHWVKERLFDKCCRDNWLTIWKIVLNFGNWKLEKMLNYIHTSHQTWRKFQWIKDANIKSETILVLEENVGELIYNMSIGRNFIIMIQKYRCSERLINILYKIKHFVHETHFRFKNTNRLKIKWWAKYIMQKTTRKLEWLY